MSALFRPWANTLVRLVLLGVVLAVGALVGFGMLWVRTPFFTGQREQVEQPVQFDHRHHVGDDGVDCVYCHDTVEKSPWAGIPSTRTCMNCHSQIWNASPQTALIRASWFDDRPIPWSRVHRLPDFVYFDHSIHVGKGVGCVTCHGRVDQMAATTQAAPLTMTWCLDCHRRPEAHLRPREEVTSLTWRPAGDPVALGRELARRYGVETRVSCTTCHR